MLYQLFLAVSVAIFIACVVAKLYAKLTSGWCKSYTCLVGKTAIVTGSNTGIGYETALDFAKRGARVILACRDKQRAEKARASIIEETGNENVVVKLVDLACFNTVRAFAKEINETEDRLDILVNNAAVIPFADEKSKDGHLLTMQINYFSSFFLTHLLIGLMRKTKQSRIVNVSSMAAKLISNCDVKNLDKFENGLYDYALSKLCNILFTIELARRVEGTAITTYSLHPGAVKTDLFKHAKGPIKLFFDILKSFFYKTVEEGAQTTIYCSVAKGIEIYNGEHFMDCQRIKPYKLVADPKLSQKLWEVTQDIIQLKPEEIAI